MTARIKSYIFYFYNYRSILRLIVFIHVKLFFHDHIICGRKIFDSRFNHYLVGKHFQENGPSVLEKLE